ncbi:MAG: D-alanyl-D-alanine carboxypeptidase [Solirubrobacterales bacterium]|nr:D-alanyl-D-alanine carboxypeptidase [Solirubrobacterales bacterium]MCB8971826.1 D-alanyl-D-alanine carboxypeptidase [Thermoleophilales bacterium]MCO5326369.1 D-alanyl-D-alanine carboxypeptidase [Solirubrobacterales bacterium]
MRRSGLLLLLVSAVAIAAVVVAEPKGEPDVSGPQRIVASAAPEVGFESAVERAEAQAPEPPTKLAARFGLEPETVPLPVVHEFKDPPKAGLMFDVGTGEILWERHPDRELPIASLTKMLTAWMIVTGHRPDEQVRISKSATKAGGSMVGVLPKGKKVRLESLMKGLLLVSGNDAAEALAEHDAGSVGAFVKRMNREAKRLGLQCSHFTSPHGLIDRGNHSCPRDLALLARADLSEPRIRKIARIDHVRLPFPIKGGFLDLWNNNPFIRAGAKGITGLKTGYTDAAGRCYVTTAERGGRELGVILLDSPNPLEQVPKLLDLGVSAGS